MSTTSRQDDALDSAQLDDAPRGWSPLSWRDRGFVAGLGALMTAGHSIAVPFVVNQNQYFVHAVGDRTDALSQDWLVNTVDPYPLFSWAAGIVYSVGGTGAIRALAFIATFVALMAVFVIARVLAPRHRLGVAAAAMVLVGLTLSVGRLGSLLPLDWSVSAFQGFAGQYILMKPGYVQPSTAGVLVLLASALLLRHFAIPEGASVRRPVLALILIGVAAALAPTYAVVTGVAALSALVADLLSRRGWRRLGWYAAAVVVGGLAAVAGSPSIISLGSADEASRAALDRFAFELFPLHTLVTNWPADDSTLLVVIAAAVILVPASQTSRWLTRWVLIATAIALVAAAIVLVTRSSTLALLFPWRVSVIVVPIAATMVAVRVALWLQRLGVGDWRWKLALFTAVIAVPGIASSVSKTSPVASESFVGAVVEARPQGVGLTPLGAGTIRLNAQVPIYVDAVSPPYAGDDLLEFWDRIENVRAYEADPEVFCTADWAAEIGWIQLPAQAITPSCVADWAIIFESPEWQILQRPAE